MSESSSTRECDVVIVGAGPAGSAAATILAQRGLDVLILERDTFPRYKVGESLIPHCWFPLERLGVIDRMNNDAFTVQKHSVQFVGKDGRSATPFYFARHTDHPCSLTWQVRRDAFDQMLLDNAIGHGAVVMMGTSAKALRTDGSRVVGVNVKSVSGDDIEVSARMTIDASGRDTFAMSRLNWGVSDASLRKVSIWTYFRGARRDCGIDEGTTTIAYLPDNGWIWFIPLPDDTVSVGVVAERDYLYRDGRDPEMIFDREAESQPWIRERLATAQRSGPIRVTGDYSYRSRHCAQDGLVLVGDAFAFLDPVFSSGVYLALLSGVEAGDAVAAALELGTTTASQFVHYSERLCEAIESMRRLVFAFYDTAFSFGDFIRAYPDLRHDLTECLIGNLNRDYTELFTAVSEYADIPDALKHGQPLVT